jgi:predicted methyltransferase
MIRMSLLQKAALAACLLSLLPVTHAVAPGFIEKLGAESRPLEDRMRDDARRPYQVMQLLGVEAGMTAVDIGAGGGWYTRVLSAAVGPSGRVISQVGPRALERDNGQAAREMASALGNVEPSFEDVADMDASIADVAVTALNMHHSNEERAIPYLRAIYDVLKPGGVAAVIDHAGSPGMENSSLHRMLASDARRWLEAAGFEIVTESDLLRTAADDHTMPVNDPRLGRNTDRFLFVVRRPQ